MIDRLVLLGTKGGPSVRKGGPMPSSSLLQLDGQTYVIDCGIGATRSLVNADVALTDIDAIFITHLHSDHLLELGPMIYTAWTSGLTKPIQIFGPEGIQDYWDNFLKSMAFDHGMRTKDDKRQPLDGLVEITTYGEGNIAKFGAISVKALRVDHPPVTHCYALRFDGPNHSIVMSADTCYFPALANFAKNADTLVHEAMLEAGIDALVARMKGAPGLRDHLMASHTMVADVGRIATKANVKNLILNHLVPADDPAFDDNDWLTTIGATWSGPTTVGKDAMSIPLVTNQT
jgi:ribonuclease BN (tRNA processing enzyme)